MTLVLDRPGAVKAPAAVAIIAARARLWRTTMPRVEKAVGRWGRSQRDTLLAALNAAKAVKAPDPSDVERILATVDWGQDTDRLAAILSSFDLTLAGGAASHLNMLGVEVDFGGRGDPAVERILAALTTRPDGPRTVPKRLLREVEGEIRDGLSRGLTYPQIGAGGTFVVRGEEVTVRGIRGIYRPLEGWQGKRIVRSEATVGYNRSSAALMRDVGIGHVDIVDGTKDEDCADANGSRWTVDEYDSNPASHPNCTRIGLPVIA